MAEPSSQAQALKACPICGCDRLHYAFSKAGQAVCRCEDCKLVLLNPQPSDAALAAIYGQGYFLGSEDPQGREAVALMKSATAEGYLDALERYRGAVGGELLEVGCGRGEFLAAAKRRGYQVSGLDVSADAVAAANEALGVQAVRCGQLETAGFAEGSFDVCVLFDAIEHVRDPAALLSRVHGLLRPGGTLFLVTPSLDSPSAKLLRQDWMEFKAEHLFYFDAETIRLALAKSHFKQVQVGTNTKVLTFEYIHHHFRRFPVRLLSGLIGLAYALVPRILSARHVRMASSGMNVFCRRAEAGARPLLSVVVPVYNERATFKSMMDTLLKKEVAGVDREIILVESNSTDGTRDEVLRFEGAPGVKILLEERPRGKGHAVRTGLAAAKGDIVLIQDADLEYDVEDYDELLLPLLRYRSSFVLGSRHSGSWKIRVFTDQPLLTATANLAHLFFAFLLNTACGTRLRDPFTMYKVFRRDCVWDLFLDGNRFDFDWELVIKLLRKGFQPMEVPVNYRSRSWGEGKKIRIFRDPPTWVWALLRFRFGRLYKF